MSLYHRARAFAGHTYRELSLYPHMIGERGPRIMFFPSSVREGASHLRAYNVADDSQLKMGDYFDLAADLYGLPRPPRISRSQAQEQLSPLSLSFMSESRRLDNRRLKRELKLRLHYPSVAEGLRA